MQQPNSPPMSAPAGPAARADVHAQHTWADRVRSADAVTDRDRLKLLFGPYQTPALRHGDRTFCLFRDCAVVVWELSDAPIPWPRCHYADGRARGFGLLVDEEMLRAIRHESAAAVGFWWGVSRSTVQHWRGAFGVGRRDNEGTHRLVYGAVQASMDSRLHGGRVWTAEEVAILGAMTDAEAARRTGRSQSTVAWKRRRLGRPPVLAIR
jgi:hypothetical protein